MLIKETLGCVKNFPKAIKWIHNKMYHDKLKGGNLTMAKAENCLLYTSDAADEL